MKRLVKLLKFLFILGLLGIFAGAITAGAVYYYLEPKLPSIENLRDVRLQVPLRVYSHDGGLIAEYGEKRRIPLTFEQIPLPMQQAFLAAEDDRFYEHPGVDYQGLLRAAVQLALTGKKKQGGSTITMQVARNFFLSNEKTYLRKLNEILLALRIDSQLSKQDVLALYLNKIYLGQRSYGVGAAAQVYYGKTVDDLSLPQIAMIAGLPKAPSRYNPIANPERALIRRNYVLGRMRELGFIDEPAYQQALQAPVTASVHAPQIEVQAPYVAELVRAEMLQRHGDNAYTDGYSVYTTIRALPQGAAVAGLRKAIDAYDQRHGYRGPEVRLGAEIIADPAQLDAQLAKTRPYADLLPGIVTEVAEKSAQVYLGETETVTLEWPGLEWARKQISEDRRGRAPKQASDILQPGDLIRVQKILVEEQPVWRLAQVPEVTGAFVSLDPSDGAITSLVGGYNFFDSKFNRVTQARRQPGSGFKPYIYSAALEAGYTAASIINDAPVVFDDPSLEGAWRPENYSGKWFGPTRIRYALTKSRNLISIRLLRSIGIDFALQHTRNFGFDPDELPHNLSLALGSANITPLQQARGYAVLANGGFLIEPYYIERVERAGAGIVYQAEPAVACPQCPLPPTGDEPPAASAEQPPLLTPDGKPAAPRTLSPENRYIMYSMMQDVITHGTGRRARVLKRRDLAGKTGTTNDQRDAWFNGYNPHVVAIAWVGFDSNKKLGRGEVGGRAALPAWIEFMRQVLPTLPPDTPPAMPDGMVTVRIDPKTGQRARPGQQDAIFEVFRAGNEPQLPAADAISPAGATGGGSRPDDDLF